jgi:hypothetical protein
MVLASLKKAHQGFGGDVYATLPAKATGAILDGQQRAIFVCGFGGWFGVHRVIDWAGDSW